MQMMSYLEICGLDCSRKISIKSVTLCCSCCLIENVSLVDATKCEHFKSYKKLFHHAIPQNGAYVCMQCHAVLMKMLKFELMVNHSEYVLQNRLKKPNKQNFMHFEITKQENINITVPDCDVLIKEESIDIELKSELEDCIDSIDEDPQVVPEDDNIDHSVGEEVVENVNVNDITNSNYEPNYLSELDKELQLYQLPKGWEGKIEYIGLTADEIAQEKAELAKHPTYADHEFKCEHCIKGFAYEFTYASHIKNKHEKKEGFELCDLCQCYVTKRNTRRHWLCHYARFRCCECKQIFKSKQGIITHYKYAHGELEGSDFKCDVCGYRAMSSRTIYNHKKKHYSQDESLFRCPDCKKTFVAESSLKKHAEVYHSNSKFSFECKTCSKKFPRMNLLNKHTKNVHSDEAAIPHYCDICNKSLKSKYILQEHMKLHSSARLECDYCGQKFKRKMEIRNHILSKHYKCSSLICKDCGKRLSSRNGLKIHIKSVHKRVERPRNKICDYCGKTFTCSTILKQHVNTHTGARPFVCELCGADFAHKAALYTHTRLVHRGGKRKRETDLEK